QVGSDWRQKRRQAALGGCRLSGRGVDHENTWLCGMTKFEPSYGLCCWTGAAKAVLTAPVAAISDRARVAVRRSENARMVCSVFRSRPPGLAASRDKTCAQSSETIICCVAQEVFGWTEQSIVSPALPFRGELGAESLPPILPGRHHRFMRAHAA